VFSFHVLHTLPNFEFPNPYSTLPNVSGSNFYVLCSRTNFRCFYGVGSSLHVPWAWP
jgi:hypothetical protein